MPGALGGHWIPNGCEALCGFWDSNLGPLEKAASALNHWAVSPVPVFLNIMFGLLTCQGKTDSLKTLSQLVVLGDISRVLSP